MVRLSRPKVLVAAVFNAEQIDGIPDLEPARDVGWDPLEKAERLLGASQAKIQHSQGGGAFYRPSTDTIHLPSREQFEKAAGYYATALHELGHWTGHSDRLNRDLTHPFGSEGASATGGCVETVGSDRKCHKRRQDDQRGRKIASGLHSSQRVAGD